MQDSIIKKFYKMKKLIIQFIWIACTGLMIASCTKKIDLTPDFQLDGSKPLATLEEADNVLTGAYNGFLSDGYFDANGATTGGPFSCFPDLMSDDLVETFESLGNYRALAEWTYVANDPYVNNTWLSTYNIISSVNIILRDIDGLSASDQKRANKIKGQALAIRAMVHFDLMRYFAPAFDRNSTELGVAYVKTFDAKARPPRNTVKECFDNIFADITSAITTLSAGVDAPINSSTARGRLDIAAVNALKARVSLYAGQWQEAVTAATAAINARPLSEASAFPLIWTDESVDEVLWAISFGSSLTDGVPYDNVFFARGNRNSYRPSAALTALYDQANDIRYPNYFANVGTLNGTVRAPRLIVVKHLGKGSATDGVVNWKVFRTGEMYLIRAEANYRLTNETLARNDLNTLRAARINGFAPGAESGTALLNAILTERRKELAFEGHRFFDFKRLNKAAINRCPSNTGSPSTICSLPSANRAWAWPIPFNEITANPAMVQNAGY
jgi:starch-binding outer membrane protein, SusD/RagB family